MHLQAISIYKAFRQGIPSDTVTCRINRYAFMHSECLKDYNITIELL
jgi:hypothetical protein